MKDKYTLQKALGNSSTLHPANAEPVGHNEPLSLSDAVEKLFENVTISLMASRTLL